MKKSIKKKAELNLSDYDYLDRISLLGWMWEFARRSKDFKDYYRNFEPIKAKGNYAQLMLFASENGPIGVFALDCKDPSEKWSDKDDITYNFACGLTKCTPVIIFNLDEYDRFLRNTHLELQGPFLISHHRMVWHKGCHTL